MYEYRATVRSIHDGDTFRADVDLGFRTWAMDEDFRVNGLNAPEIGTVAGLVARDYLRAIMPIGSTVVIKTTKDKREKYGRMLAQITAADGTDVNAALIATGHAFPYNGEGPKPTS